MVGVQQILCKKIDSRHKLSSSQKNYSLLARSSCACYTTSRLRFDKKCSNRVNFQPINYATTLLHKVVINKGLFCSWCTLLNFLMNLKNDGHVHRAMCMGCFVALPMYWHHLTMCTPNHQFVSKLRI